MVVKVKSDAIEILKSDHRKVEQAFSEYEKLGERAFVGKKKLADSICADLTVHAEVEEALVYPAFKEAVEEKKALVNEATVEHASAKDLIAQIQSMKPEDELFDAKIKVLSEYIKHHVKEEEKEMFPALKKSGIDLAALGEQIQAMRKQLH